MKLTVYGIPSCGTVKKARAWLDSKRLDYTWVDLRESPPSSARIKRWVKTFGTKPMRNTSGGSYRALPEEKKTWDDATWTTHFIDDPMLLKRPVLEIDGTPTLVGFKEADWKAALK